MAFSFGTGAFAAENVITVDGEYKISVSDSSLLTAAQKMSEYIYNIAGITLSAELNAAGEKLIAINNSADGNGYKISVSGNTIIISGSDLSQTVRGIYAFLEEFGGMRSYLISRLLINPYCDCDALVEEFCNSYYGDAGRYVKDFIDLSSEAAKRHHLCIYEPMNKTMPLTDKEVKQCNELWKKAEESAADESLTNVLNSEISWRWWKMENRKSEFASPFKYSAEKKQLLADISAAGVTRLTESGNDFQDFFVSFFWDLYVSLYSVVNVVLKIIYKA